MRFFWHPKTGELKTFGLDETPPDDWLDHHPADPAFTKAAADKGEPEVEKQMAPAELAAALKAGGIAFADDASPSELTRLLVESLRVHLKAKGVAFSMLDGPRKLLSLASGE